MRVVAYWLAGCLLACSVAGADEGSVTAPGPPGTPRDAAAMPGDCSGNSAGRCCDNGGGCCDDGGGSGGGSGWYFQADALFLNRDNGRGVTIIEEGIAGPGLPPRGQRAPLLTTDALDFDYEIGPRLTLGRSLCCCGCVELTYFTVHHSAAVTRFESGDDQDVPFDADISSDFDGAQQISAFYDSDLHSVEVNYLRHWDRVTGLIGFRYISLDEDFDLRATDNLVTSDYLIDTDNDLVGGQIGAIFNRSINDRFDWNFSAKAGLYVNFVSQETLLRDNGNTTVLRDFSNSEEELAFVGELGLNFWYYLSDGWALTFGYQLMWLEGVALAPEQLDFTTTATSGSGLNHNGGVFLDGAYIGLRYEW